MEKLPGHSDLQPDAVLAGVDLGGTRLRAGLVNADGMVLRTSIVPSTTGHGPVENAEILATMIERMLDDAGIARHSMAALGFGTSGPVDIHSGLISNPYTLPSWSGVALRLPLESRLGIPVRFENDASVAALGEYWHGAGKGARRMVMITIGTGIGGALVVDGQLYTGATSFHPEMGHQSIDPNGPLCYCGLHGCWEQLIAGPALARDWARVRDHNAEQADPGAEALFAAARAGDHEATALVRRVGRYLGLGLVNVTAFLAPDVIVIGGGVSEHFDLLEPFVAAEMGRVSGLQPPGGVQVRRSMLADEAGILGAAYLVSRGLAGAR